MAFDLNNNYRGVLYGRDRLGYTTPDADASEPLRPFLPIPYPAPWLPAKRLDEGHPVGANVVLSSHQLVGVDKSGGLVPAGLVCGSQTAVDAAVTSAVIQSGVCTVTLTTAGDSAKFAVGDNVVFTNISAGSTQFPVRNGSAVQAVLSAVGTGTLSFATTATGTVTISGSVRSVNGYVVVQYGQNDVGFATNPATGKPVASAGEYVVIAAPSDGAVGDTVTLPNGKVITIKTTGGNTAIPSNDSDLSFALACNLLPGGVSKPIGYVVRNAFQYIGTTIVVDVSGGLDYTLNAVTPEQWKVHNYMHEMGTAIQTHFVLRLPWIGSNPTALQTLANSDLITNYTQTDFGRSFVHFTGGTAGAPNQLNGSSVVASRQGFGNDAGNYAPYNSAVNGVDEICGRILGVEYLFPIRDFANRVRTQFERATEAVGPYTTKTPMIGELGGSATRGMDYAINLTTDGVFRLAKDQGVAVMRPEYMTYFYIHVNCR